MKDMGILMSLALATSFSGVTGLEGMTPRGVPSDMLALYLFEKGIVRKVCLQTFIESYYDFHGAKLTKVSAQQVLNKLHRCGILSKSFNTEIKDFEYKLNTQESI
jgi:hypothetical protein